MRSKPHSQRESDELYIEYVELQERIKTLEGALEWLFNSTLIPFENDKYGLSEADIIEGDTTISHGKTPLEAIQAARKALQSPPSQE